MTKSAYQPPGARARRRHPSGWLVPTPLHADPERSEVKLCRYFRRFPSGRSICIGPGRCAGQSGPEIGLFILDTPFLIRPQDGANCDAAHSFPRGRPTILSGCTRPTLRSSTQTKFSRFDRRRPGSRRKPAARRPDRDCGRDQDGSSLFEAGALTFGHSFATAGGSYPA